MVQDIWQNIRFQRRISPQCDSKSVSQELAKKKLFLDIAWQKEAIEQNA